MDPAEVANLDGVPTSGVGASGQELTRIDLLKQFGKGG